jgi:adenylate cyclase
MIFMRKVLLMCVFCSQLFIPSFAQNKGQARIDSMLSVLSGSKEDTGKVKTLLRLSTEYSKIQDHQKSEKFANDALSLSKRIGFKKGEILALKKIGNIRLAQGMYPEATDNFRQSLKISSESGIREEVADAYGNIGLVCIYQGNFPEALKNYFSSLKIRKELGDKKVIASLLGNIGGIYVEQGYYPEALKFLFSSLRICEETGDKSGIANSYNSIGNVYETQGNYREAVTNFLASLKIYEEVGEKRGISAALNNLGNVYYEQSDYSAALKNYTVALKIKEEIGDKKGIAGSYYNLGRIYTGQANYSEALKNYFICLKVSEEIGHTGFIAYSNLGIGQTYLDQKKFSQARKFLNRAIVISKNIGTIELISSGYQILSGLDSLQGDFRQSLEHYRLFIVYRDSLVNEENTKKITRQQMQYEFDKKEALAKAEQEKKDAIAQKELQQQKLVRNGFIGGFVVVLLFAGVFFTQRNKIRKGKKRSDELLLNILPAEVAEELKEKGSAEAKQIDDVTVLFTDFKGFTQLAEQLSPRELVAKIDECFSAFDQIMQKHGVEKIKTIGDSYMAAGGLPTPNETHACDVVRAALDIQEYMKDHKAKKEAERKLFFEIRIGVHTGPVVAGIVGVKKFAYDIWGDTVNIASRMESCGEPGKVNVSGTTYELVKDKFICSHRGKIQAKNKGEVDMYFVEASHPPVS